MDAKRREDVERVLDQMRPWIRSDGGDVSLVDISARGVVTVRLEGNCVGCGAQQMTLDDGIKSVMVSQLDWVTSVVALEGEAQATVGPGIRSLLDQDMASTEALLVELDDVLLSMEPADPLPEQVNQWLTHFDTRLSLLMNREEQCVFPVLRDFLNTASGPVAMMTRDHTELKQKNEELRAAAEAFEPWNDAARTRLRDAGRAVTRQLSSHLIKERASVIELLDRALPDDLRKEVIQDLQRHEAARLALIPTTREGAKP
ncbi:MAG: NifU family protein [Planctomycetes bacterium]|nr:NifU family protein [Planctomycetota bacterium]